MKMAKVEKTLQFAFKDFREKILHGSGLREVIRGIDFPSLNGLYVFECIFTAKINIHPPDFCDFIQEREQKLHSTESDSQISDRLKISENKWHGKDSSDGFVSIKFDVKKIYKTSCFSEIFRFFVSVVDVAGEKRFTKSGSAGIDDMLQNSDRFCNDIYEYIKCSTLLQKKEELLPGDTLTLLCDISLESYNREERSPMNDWCEFRESWEEALLRYKCSSLDDLDNEDGTNMMPNYEKSIWEYLGYEISGNSSLIKLNKINLSPWKEELCNASSYFEGLFFSGLSESLTGMIHIPREEDLHFARMIFSILYDTVGHLKGVCSLLLLYVTAEKYLVDSIKRKCVKHMMRILSFTHIKCALYVLGVLGVEHVVPTFLIAAKHKERVLQYRSLCIILENWEQVTEAYGWTELKTFEPELYERLLRLYETGENPQNFFLSEEIQTNDTFDLQFSSDSMIQNHEDKLYNFYQ